MSRRSKSSSQDATPEPAATNRADAAYTVVARRYRPQRFEEVVGQDHVVQALRNAIRLNRVTHAYLFSGTRGVGKTSIARIFAKALNCKTGPTETPCNECDICKSIAAGQDVDVIEIDGASNNGVEQVRELRQNAGLRPSRSRYKIYYIDEVHMLSTGAFNALLKTLEEPPEHVKFLFATTEPNKIPVTVLSRCQRFDFAGITPEKMLNTLTQICAAEGIDVEPEALKAVVRRAGGSMRDAQSLLEQLLTFGATKLTTEQVHEALGLAPDERVLELIDALADHETARALQLFDATLTAGSQPAELVGGLIEYLRDVMVLAAGAEIDRLAATPAQAARVQSVARRWPLDAILLSLQILSETRARMRGSPHGRILIEVALCRIARLPDFTDLSAILASLDAAGAASPAALEPKKKVAEPPAIGPVSQPPAASAAPIRAEPPRPTAPESTLTPAPLPQPESRPPEPPFAASTPTQPPEPPPPAAASPAALELSAAHAAWANLPEQISFPLCTRVGLIGVIEVEPPDQLVIGVPDRYNYIEEECDRPATRNQLEAHLSARLGMSVRIRFQRVEDDSTAADLNAERAESLDELEREPLVQSLSELFEARRVRVELGEDPTS